MPPTQANLPAKFVIHTVGPVWRGGSANEAELLANCYRRSMELAEEHNFHSIAFPSISTGVYGYPIESAVQIAVKEVSRCLSDHDGSIDVIFCCFSEGDLRCYEAVLRERNE